jgi:uncharacterized membrane protein YdfJ with MMPL/SSD domain
VVLAADPFSQDAVAAVPKLRDVVHTAEPRALVGGQTAQSFDLREAADRDNLVIPPLTLGVVLLVLIALLRALVAPVLLLLATALSAAAALGAGVVIFDLILDLPAVDPTLPLLAFVFSSPSESTTPSSSWPAPAKKRSSTAPGLRRPPAQRANVDRAITRRNWSGRRPLVS